MITACHNCKLNGKGDKRCEKCRRVSQDDIRIRKTPHNVRPELVARKTADGSEQATPLPEDVEDKLRRLICTVTDLEPLAALMLLHVAKGGTPEMFGNFTNKLIEDVRKYGPIINRVTATNIWKRVIEKFAPFATLRQWDRGHGGRPKKMPNPNAPLIYQAELPL